MIADYIALAILVISVGVVLIIFFRKFPVLSSINIKELPWHQQDEVKADLIEHRLFRKLKTAAIWGRKRAHPFREWLEGRVRALRAWIRHLEQKYEVPVQQLSSEDKAGREKQIARLFDESAELFKAKEYHLAEKKMIEVISLDPKKVDAYKTLGEVYFAMKDYRHAKEVLHYVLKLNQQDDELHARLGRIAASEGHFEEARQEYVASIALKYQLADHHIDLAETQMQLGNMQEARKSFEEALRLEPSNPRNLDAFLEFAITIKDQSLAKSTLAKLRDVNPENQKLKEFEDRIDNLGK